LENPHVRLALRIVHRGVHAGMARRFLHPLKFPLLFIELLLELRDTLRLIVVVRRLVLDAFAHGMKRRMERVDPRLQRRYLIFLCQNLSLPLVSRALFRLALFGKMTLC